MRNVFCVVGATRGTGYQIAKQLIERGESVRVVARSPGKARSLFGTDAQVLAGDVTRPHTLRSAIESDCRAVFFAVDVTGGLADRSYFGSRAATRDVTFQGLVNVVEAAEENEVEARIVLLSGMGCDKRSLAGAMLNLVKGNLQRNMVDRERYLSSSGLDFVIGRGAVLSDAPGHKARIEISRPIHRLSPFRRIARSDFARALILAATSPDAGRRTFDIYNEGGLATPDDELLKKLSSV